MPGPPLLPSRPSPPGNGDEAVAGDTEEGAESKWESLPSELLCLVLSRLRLSDLVRSAVVCRRWRESAGEAYDEDDGGRRSCGLPWLWGLDSRDFHSLPDRWSYRLDMPEEMLDGAASFAGVDGVHEDWFVVSTWSCGVAVDDFAQNKPYRYFLYNPFSRVRIDLPTVHIHSPRRRFNDPWPRFAFSRNPADPGCVAAFFRHPKEGVGFCTNLAAAAAASSTTVGCNQGGSAGEGNEVGGGWKMIPCVDNETAYVNVAFYNGLICLATASGALHVADTVSLEIRTALPSPPRQNLPHRLSPHVPHHYRGWTRIREYTLRVAAGELLMLCSLPVPYYGRRTPIAIYRANFELGRWEILQSLSGQGMLVGPLSLFLVRLPPDQSSSCGLKGDCIYLLGGDHPVRKLRLTEQSCRTFNLVEEDLGRRSDFRPSSFYKRRFLMLAPPKPKFYVVS